MYRFEHNTLLWWMLCIPALVVIYFLYLHNRKKKLKRLFDANLQHVIIPDVSKSKRLLKLLLFLIAGIFVILGMANLQTGSKMKEVKREGADIILCLDVSNSMLAEDLSPNRLERAKQAIEKMIDKLEGDRIGLIVFAGEAYVQLPITTDYGAAKLFLNGIRPNMIAVQGTAIGAAIEKATESFGSDEGKNRAIVVITDGENHEDDALKATEEAAKNGIVVHTIGIGSESGVPIPNYQNGVPAGYKTDAQGNTVITKLNQDLLKLIAADGNGVYVKASNSDLGLNAVLDKISELDKKEIESKMYSDYEDQFQWFFAMALFILIIETLINEKISLWWKKLNLFKQHA